MTPRLSGLALALCVATSPTMAMTYDVHGSVVTARGDVEKDELDRFIGAVEGITIGRVVLDSGGGFALPALKIAQWVHAHHVTTGVVKGGRCASSCVMIWASGEKKTLPYNGAIGVHQCDAPTQVAIDACLHGTIELFQHTGAPDSVLADITITPNDDIHWLSLAELRAWKVEIK